MHLLYQILPYTTADLSARNSQLDSLSDPLETSQTRIEAQRQTTLANQLRSNIPIMSHSLDASSPEGRQTWMELRKHLRNEGITPAKIPQNRARLVNAMKTVLPNVRDMAESVPDSYATRAGKRYRQRRPVERHSTGQRTPPQPSLRLPFP